MSSVEIRPVYVFQNGTRIALRKIISIGAIEKDEQYNIIIKIYCTGYHKPIVFILGNSIGFVTPEQKNRIEAIYNDFINQWETFVIQNG